TDPRGGLRAHPHGALQRTTWGPGRAEDSSSNRRQDAVGPVPISKTGLPGGTGPAIGQQIGIRQELSRSHGRPGSYNLVLASRSARAVGGVQRRTPGPRPALPRTTGRRALTPEE